MWGVEAQQTKEWLSIRSRQAFLGLFWIKLYGLYLDRLRICLTPGKYEVYDIKVVFGSSKSFFLFILIYSVTC